MGKLNSECDKCTHRKVCKYAENYIKAVDTINQVSFVDANSCNRINVIDMTCLNLERGLRCRFFSEESRVYTVYKGD